MTDADTATERGTGIETETTVDPETVGVDDGEDPMDDDPFDVPTPGGLRGLV